jgi:hypothetical protein
VAIALLLVLLVLSGGGWWWRRHRRKARLLAEKSAPAGRTQKAPVLTRRSASASSKG